MSSDAPKPERLIRTPPAPADAELTFTPRAFRPEEYEHQKVELVIRSYFHGTLKRIPDAE